MASVTKCNARWTCRVTTPNSVVKKTFNTKKEAIAWSAMQDLESLMSLTNNSNFLLGEWRDTDLPQKA